MNSSALHYLWWYIPAWVCLFHFIFFLTPFRIYGVFGLSSRFLMYRCNLLHDCELWEWYIRAYLSFIFMGFCLRFHWNRYCWVRVQDVNWKIVSLPNQACKLFWKSSKFRWIFGLPWDLSLWICSHNGECAVLWKKVRTVFYLYLINLATLFLFEIIYFDIFVLAWWNGGNTCWEGEICHLIHPLHY